MRIRDGIQAIVPTVVALYAAAALAGPAGAAPGGEATVEETSFTAAHGSSGDAVASCPAGRRVVGGGVGTTAGTVGSFIQVSGPLDETGPDRQQVPSRSPGEI